MNKVMINKDYLNFIEKKVSAKVVCLVGFLILLMWQILVDLNIISAFYLPSPLMILQAMFAMFSSGELLINLAASLTRIGIGFFLGAFFGILLGLFLGYDKLAAAIGLPIINALYPIPKIALLPLIILWFGIGEMPKIIIIALGVFFVVFINTYQGVKNIDQLYLKVAFSFRKKVSEIIYDVIFLATLPAIFTGIRLAAGVSLLLLVSAEMISAKYGLGAMILNYGELMLIDKLMVGIVMLSLIGLAFNALIDVIEKKFLQGKY